MKILSSDPMWKGGISSEREVTETLSVQSLACLPYQIVITILHLKNVNGGDCEAVKRKLGLGLGSSLTVLR
jgi:hypothetical protein